MLALIFPIVIGLISYGIAWTMGLVGFDPKPIALAAGSVPKTASPIVVFMINLAVATTVVTIFSVPLCFRRRNWLARVHAYAANRCRSAATSVTERRDMGTVARATYPGGLYPGGSATGRVCFAMDGHCDRVHSFVFARLRLATGSISQAIILHAAPGTALFRLRSIQPVQALVRAFGWVSRGFSSRSQ